MSTWKCGMRSRTIPGASGAFRFSVMLFLFRAYTFQCTLTPASRQSRSVSPRPGVSPFTTSAPKSASCRLSILPATSREKSSTRTPSSGPGRPGSKVTLGNGIEPYYASAGGVTRVEREHLPRDTARHVAREEHGGVDDVVRGDHALERRALDHRLAHGLDGNAGHPALAP